MGNVTSNVTAGKPKVEGSIFRAPLGTQLPTDSSSELAEAFKCVGYVSDEGVKNNDSRESEIIKAWGGDSVLTIQTSKDDTFAFTLIETLNTEVLKMVHGDDNVSGEIATGIKVLTNSKELTAACYVIDMILRDNAIKRIVIPNASVSEVGEITYSDSDVVGYPVTLQCMPDGDGNTHTEYIIRPITALHTVTQNLTNVTSSFGGNTIEAGQAFTADLTATTGYTLDEVAVTMGGTDITESVYSDGTVTIPGVTGAIVITAVAHIYFGVTQNLTNVTSDFTGERTIGGQSFTAQLTADDTYTMDSVTVTMGGEDVTATAYDSAENTVTIAAVNGAIVITAEAVE